MGVIQQEPLPTLLGPGSELLKLEPGLEKDPTVRSPVSCSDTKTFILGGHLALLGMPGNEETRPTNIEFSKYATEQPTIRGSFFL